MAACLAPRARSRSTPSTLRTSWQARCREPRRSGSTRHDLRPRYEPGPAFRGFPHRGRRRTIRPGTRSSRLHRPAKRVRRRVDANAGTTAGAPLLTWGEVERRTEPIGLYSTWDSPLRTRSFPRKRRASIRSSSSPAFRRRAGDPHRGADGLRGGLRRRRGHGKDPRSSGPLLTVASMPAGTLKNVLVVNTTRSSQALIDSMTGTTATMQQPQTTASLIKSTAAVPAPVEDDTWATGDTSLSTRSSA